MRVLKPLIVASALVAGGSAFAQGRSSEVEMAQGIRQSALAFTEQTQNRGFGGVFLPVLTFGLLGDTRAYDDRITTQSITQRPLPYQRPGSINNREWIDQGAYSEPLAYAGPVQRQRVTAQGNRGRYASRRAMGPYDQPMAANRGVSFYNPSQRGMR